MVLLEFASGSPLCSGCWTRSRAVCWLRLKVKYGGSGGISAVSKATGVSRQVIRQGLRELEEVPTHPAGRIRRVGGGRKKARQKDPTLVADLERLVEPATRGDPESSLRWTCKSVRKLAEQLEQMGHAVSYPVVAQLLHEME